MLLEEALGGRHQAHELDIRLWSKAVVQPMPALRKKADVGQYPVIGSSPLATIRPKKWKSQ
jgi:hypothetical protein